MEKGFQTEVVLNCCIVFIHSDAIAMFNFHGIVIEISKWQPSLTPTGIYESHTDVVAAKITEKVWKLVQNKETTITIIEVNGG